MNLNSDAISWPVYRLLKTVENLLFFLEVPDAETVARREWLETISADIAHDFQAVAGSLTDQRENHRISRLRVDATHFANMLNANPGIRISDLKEITPPCLVRLRAFQRELEATVEQAEKTTPDIATVVPDDDAAAGYTKQDLCDFTGYGGGAVNKRLKDIGIAPATGGRPRKDAKPFSRDQVIALLQSILEDSGAQEFNKKKCSESLKTLTENP